MPTIDFLDKTFQAFSLNIFAQKAIFACCPQEKAPFTASIIHEKNFLSGNIFEKEIEKVHSKKWILDIDDQALKFNITYIHFLFPFGNGYGLNLLFKVVEEDVQIDFIFFYERLKIQSCTYNDRKLEYYMQKIKIFFHEKLPEQKNAAN